MRPLALLLLAAAAFGAGPALAASYTLAPFKDELFQYPRVLETRDGGDYAVVEYLKERDLYGRDEITERRAWSKYVKSVRQTTARYVVDGRSLKFIGAGRFDGGARAVVVYIHGQGGDRFQGANDWTFGGNFNRIKNLMVANGGAYLSPDFTDIGERGTAEIRLLVLDQRRRSPDAAIFIACGSQGGTICWRLAQDSSVAPELAGLLLLGSGHDDSFVERVASRQQARIPVYIGHGTADPIFPWQEEATFYERVRKAARGYPIRITLFDTGVHGTPIRMTDWRLVLNWMLAAGGR